MYKCTKCTVPTLENALLESLGIFSVMLHAMPTQDISGLSAEHSDHSDSTSGDSHVTTMAVIVKRFLENSWADYFNKTMSYGYGLD